MIKQTLICDRCGKMCAEYGNNRGYHIFRKYYLRKSTGNRDYLDLCQSCYDDLAQWMKIGKAESEGEK